jgi:hypothetical protein
MKRKLSSKDFLILVLFILLAISAIVIYEVLQVPEGHPFVGPIDEQTAVKNVAKFRGQITIPTTKSYGVYYDSAEIRHYLDSIYPKTKDSILPSRLHPGYVWKVGFYWMMTKDSDSITKHDFCVMPILVNQISKKVVIDYFNDGNYYTHPKYLSSPLITGGDPGNAYDAGTLWP